MGSDHPGQRSHERVEGAARILGRVCAGLLALALAAPARGDTAEDPGMRQVGGMTVYLGVMPAAMARHHGGGPNEAKMHGGGRGVPGEHHVTVALYDSLTGERISAARVTARIVGAPADAARALEPMAIAGTITYGNYLLMPRPGTYEIRVEILRPGEAKPVTTTFLHQVTQGD